MGFFMYVIVNTLHKGDNKDNNSNNNNNNIFQPKHNVIRVFSSQAPMHKFTWLLFPSEPNTRITYIVYVSFQYLIYTSHCRSNLLNSHSVLYPHSGTQLMWCNWSGRDINLQVSCLVSCVLCLLFYYYLGGGVDETIIPRNAAANGPIVPSVGDRWFRIQHSCSDKWQCQTDVVEGEAYLRAIGVPQIPLEMHSDSTWVSVTATESFVHRTAMLICCSMSVTGLRRPINFKLTACVGFERVKS
jgi:hypothetical protein